MNLHAADLAGAPLLLIRRAESDHTVEIDADRQRLVVGRIMLVTRASGLRGDFVRVIECPDVDGDIMQ